MIDALRSGWPAACSRNCAEKPYVVPSPVPCDVITSAAAMRAKMRVRYATQRFFKAHLHYDISIAIVVDFQLRVYRDIRV